MACWFGVGQCVAWFADAPIHLCRGEYLRAMELAVKVPDLFRSVRALRAEGVHLADIAPADLARGAPAIDPQVAALLCRRFLTNPRPAVVGSGIARRQ